MILHRLFSLFSYIILLQQAKDCLAADKHGRVFTKGKGETLSISTGDTVVSSLIVSTMTQKIPVHPPYRWYYAIRNDQLLFFTYTKGRLFPKLKPKIIQPKTGKYAKINFINHGKKKDHIGLVGSLIGILMTTKELPFNLLFCNSKHYVEYLSRGYSKGRWYKLLYNSTSKNCPVYAELDNSSNLLYGVFDSRSFVLKDKVGNKIPLEVYDWPWDVMPYSPEMNRDRQGTWHFKTKARDDLNSKSMGHH
ncbi:unnamed protein product [Bemisia tabaci]|uniref:Uncharacterized protein n=1 Tax=Bemisia tabaci TaxID=7038 RepID=A0A9P0F9P8_BEMTA|nr:unnamed protein product [Bemisia tabaci]